MNLSQRVAGLSNPLKAVVCFTALAAIGLFWSYAEAAAQGPVNIIQNGGFEERVADGSGLPVGWGPASNYGGEFGWYDEAWPEAVRTGQFAQLMEIDDVYTDTEAVMAIYQTLNLAANAEYDLTIHAIMRSDYRFEERNQGVYEMQWGVDPLGEGRLANVETWLTLPLTEQYRLGSNGTFPDDVPLFYEVATGTIRTGPTNARVSLFIKGVKNEQDAPEVNFNIDDVSLVGPIYNRGTTSVLPTSGESLLPVTGEVTGSALSPGAVILGSLVLLATGAVATSGLLGPRRDDQAS
ncbi:MAG TPA: hypothetical protein PKE64_07885 [Anaerolineae bacterium]|nr:hypothetical protein [Anaerolineae bacterium]